MDRTSYGPRPILAAVGLSLICTSGPARAAEPKPGPEVTWTGTGPGGTVIVCVLLDRRLRGADGKAPADATECWWWPKAPRTTTAARWRTAKKAAALKLGSAEAAARGLGPPR